MTGNEVLETGYGDATPPADNLLNDFVRGAAVAFASLAAARGEAITDDAELGLTMTDGGSPTPFGNAVVLRRPLRDGEWIRATDRMHAFFSRRDGGPFMVFSAWPTPDLGARGFALVGHPPLMWRAPGPVTVRPIPGFEVREVTGPKDARDWEYVMVHGYPVPELQPFEPGRILPPAALAARGWRHLLGTLEGRPVATASAYADDRHVRVEFVAVLGDVRGRGIGYATSAAATTSRPGVPATLLTSDDGRPTYEAMGYRSLLRFTLWAGHRGAPG
jgi:hypothetical protein